ncbi:hypothetical protein HXX76_008162 [Chlamydomonas incerta]|uniref:protein-tyrosine-phosphatase n=1 Tax=Chlamydomonas incerta TaxID=51695 RepID=A0A835T4Q6_CHLIN|nr:hypothetical protein HXX76_008162 [Chlamydomonas incerta]|eukprot:KAG2433804.1 hypothetical protein HXX76_008162 [Chlamydomonas incerta]
MSLSQAAAVGAAAPSSSARSATGSLAAETLAESVERVVVSPVFRTGPWDAQRMAQQRTVHQAHILLVSESDVCRSVLAAAALRQLLAEAGLAEAVVVDTCGTRPYNLGEEPEPNALVAAEALGLLQPHSAAASSSGGSGGSEAQQAGGSPPQPHRARLFTAAEDMVGADLVLVMDKYTAGDVMREVSSFDLVNRSQPLTYKVRRLGEFCDWAPPQPPPGAGAAAAAAAAAAAPPPEYGSEGDELDIEDPLYGNVGGDDEARAVLRTARAILRCCQGLVAFLSHLRDQQSQLHQAQLSAGSGGEVGAAQDPAAAAMTTLGPALRAHLTDMAPAAWLAPPMLSPRVDREQLPDF